MIIVIILKRKREREKKRKRGSKYKKLNKIIIIIKTNQK